MIDHKEIVDKWYNSTHGMELEPNINMGMRGNENGVLFWCVYLLLMRATNQRVNWVLELERFELLAEDLKSQGKDGLFNRGAGEDSIPKDKKRSISHDNISALSTLSVFLDPDKKVAKDIYKYGKKHFFIYNNGVKFRLPMNPSNYSIWAFNGGSKFLWYLFLPFYLINLLITIFKPYGNTSSKILYFVELAAVKDKHFIWKFFWKIWVAGMLRHYKDEIMQSLMTIYYKHPENPIRDLGYLLDQQCRH